MIKKLVFQTVLPFCSCFGGFVTEGYGMTETACFISTCDMGDNTSGHVGSPTAASGDSLNPLKIFK